jgi:hypothetical protein
MKAIYYKNNKLIPTKEAYAILKIIKLNGCID